MELMFNELSAIPCATDQYQANELMIQFAHTFKKSREFGFKRIRTDKSVYEIQLAEDGYTFNSWLIDKSISPELKSFMLSSIIPPFINDEDSEIEDAYCTATYLYKKDEQNKLPCLGLAAAHLYELPSISLNTSKEWQSNQLPIIIEKNDSSAEELITNVFSESCFDQADIAHFVENLGEIELVKTTLKSDQKNIHLADHHGKKELKDFCDKIKHCEYVTSMRSTHWGGNTFIRNIHKNGVVEIVLVHSQRQYALWIQTTGRNRRETQAIANVLREKYS